MENLKVENVEEIKIELSSFYIMGIKEFTLNSSSNIKYLRYKDEAKEILVQEREYEIEKYYFNILADLFLGLYTKEYEDDPNMNLGETQVETTLKFKNGEEIKYYGNLSTTGVWRQISDIINVLEKE
ncbi:hypothetical protein [Peptoniphilus stercorisuis]|uniref:DUF4367 domain-containing protein n=1 Tax=Peptoniphilus stercorisuis TaxID=1436965 RepID=A0ABS4KCW8_9FIRM|nr:hypothetical protein [Peptoniphilus stercorisuis]MBP2025607.1 hypothetical protein [Peptoniphilus stercorisuis]